MVREGFSEEVRWCLSKELKEEKKPMLPELKWSFIPLPPTVLCRPSGTSITASLLPELFISVSVFPAGLWEPGGQELSYLSPYSSMVLHRTVVQQMSVKWNANKVESELEDLFNIAAYPEAVSRPFVDTQLTAWGRTTCTIHPLQQCLQREDAVLQPFLKWKRLYRL